MIPVAQLLTPPPAGPEDPLAHLVACHRRIEQRLATLERVAAHMDVDPAEAAAALGRALGFLDSSGALHTRDEEESLFPRLLPLLDAGERAVVDRLHADHEAADLLYARVKELAAQLTAPNAADAVPGAFDQAVRELATLYRAHIACEDGVLFPLAEQRLPAEARAAMETEFRARRA